MKITEIITESKQEEITEHLQLNEVDARNFDSDEDFYNAVNAPAKPRYRGRQSPGVNPDDEDYFREIFRKKREAAKKAEQDGQQGVAEAQVDETIKKVGSQYEVVSKSGKNMGKSPTKAGAVKRLGQVEYFKHHPGK
jgi:hypothetical protein